MIIARFALNVSKAASWSNLATLASSHTTPESPGEPLMVLQRNGIPYSEEEIHQMCQGLPLRLDNFQFKLRSSEITRKNEDGHPADSEQETLQTSEWQTFIYPEELTPNVIAQLLTSGWKISDQTRADKEFSELAEAARVFSRGEGDGSLFALAAEKRQAEDRKKAVEELASAAG